MHSRVNAAWCGFTAHSRTDTVTAHSRTDMVKVLDGVRGEPGEEGRKESRGEKDGGKEARH